MLLSSACYDDGDGVSSACYDDGDGVLVQGLANDWPSTALGYRAGFDR